VVYKWYILPIGGLYGTYHLLREPGNSIDKGKFTLMVNSHVDMHVKLPYDYDIGGSDLTSQE